MPFTYIQSTGAILENGVMIGRGYSGHGDGLNNPAMEAVRNVGPIPAGFYRIGPSEDRSADGKGTNVMTLTPTNGNTAHQRSGFLCHGDNKAMNHTASDGCIIAALPIRLRIAQAQVGPHPDCLLEVLPEAPGS